MYMAIVGRAQTASSMSMMCTSNQFRCSFRVVGVLCSCRVRGPWTQTAFRALRAQTLVFGAPRVIPLSRDGHRLHNPMIDAGMTARPSEQHCKKRCPIWCMLFCPSVRCLCCGLPCPTIKPFQWMQNLGHSFTPALFDARRESTVCLRAAAAAVLGGRGGMRVEMDPHQAQG